MAKDADIDKSFISTKRFEEHITSLFFFSRKVNNILLRPQTIKHFCSVTNATNSVHKKMSYLVLRIFRNCKISENWISLRALKNLKPAVKKKKNQQTLVKNNSNYNTSLTMTVINEINRGSIQNVKYLWNVLPYLMIPRSLSGLLKIVLNLFP